MDETKSIFKWKFVPLGVGIAVGMIVFKAATTIIGHRIAQHLGRASESKPTR